MSRLFSKYALLWIVLGGAVIRFAALRSQGFWFDESLAIGVITQKPGDMLSQILLSETNPPLYFMAAKVWVQVFGLGEAGLRSLSAVAGTATIPVAYLAAKSLLSRRAGLAVAALTAFSPFMIWYSQDARTYALFAFFSAVAFLFFVRALQGGSHRWLWSWAIACILAACTHYFGFLLAGIEAIVLFYSLRTRRLDVVLSSAAIGAAALGLLPMILAQRDLAGWIPILGLGDRVAQVPAHFAAGMTVPWPFVAPLAAVAVPAIALYAATRADAPTRRTAAIGAGLALAGLGITLIAVAIGSDYLVTRNLIALWVPLTVAIGALIAAPAMGRAGPALIAAMCAAGAALAIWTAATPLAGRPDWGGLVAGLGTPQTTRAILGNTPFFAPVERYMPAVSEVAPGTQETVQELDVVTLRPAVKDYSVGPCWWVAFCGGRNLVGPNALAFEPPAGFRLFDSGQTTMFDYRRYRAAQPVVLPPAPFGGMLVQTAP